MPVLPDTPTDGLRQQPHESHAEASSNDTGTSNGTIDDLVDPFVGFPVRDIFDDTESISPAEKAQGARTGLRNLLVAADAAAAVLAWSQAQIWGTSATKVQVAVAVAVLATLSVGVANAQRLYRARVCAIRSIELARLGRVAVVTGAAALVIGQITQVHMLTRWLVFGTLGQYLIAGVLRGRFTQWLQSRRTAGDYQRPVILVGDNNEARELWQLTLDHPETGYRVTGFIGDPAKAVDNGLVVPWLGSYEDLPSTLGKNQWVIVAGSALSPAGVNQVVRRLWTAGVHVQVSSGLAGISYRRIRPLPLAHEPLFYLERSTPSRSQLAAKRALDLVLGSVVLVCTLPVLLGAAAAVKIHDGGPVIYRQQRIGRFGKPFNVYKLRTMVPDATSLLHQVQHLNQRHGPLFKLSRDPRVTRIGRLLRASSIDELPQLFNVLRGEMSMVGPRPALAEEVASFDEDHQARQLVTPGLTGLWQVEGRDNPSFVVYRRLDLFYLENWSIFLDLMIIAATAGVVARRARRAVWPHPLLPRPSRRRSSPALSLD